MKPQKDISSSTKKAKPLEEWEAVLNYVKMDFLGTDYEDAHSNMIKWLDENTSTYIIDKFRLKNKEAW
jgi:hypothetical protein